MVVYEKNKNMKKTNLLTSVNINIIKRFIIQWVLLSLSDVCDMDALFVKIFINVFMCIFILKDLMYISQYKSLQNEKILAIILGFYINIRILISGAWCIMSASLIIPYENMLYLVSLLTISFTYTLYILFPLSSTSNAEQKTTYKDKLGGTL